MVWCLLKTERLCGCKTPFKNIYNRDVYAYLLCQTTGVKLGNHDELALKTGILYTFTGKRFSTHETFAMELINPFSPLTL